MSRIKDKIGKVYGRLTVVSLSDKKGKNRDAHWNCVCECGNTAVVSSPQLEFGKTKSCGCLSATIGGLSNTREYTCWANMIKRCDPLTGHKNYGLKGIHVCEEWFDFLVFLHDMGYQQNNKMSIERLDNTEGYCKDNCVWKEFKFQSRNKTKKSTNTSGYTGVQKKVNKGTFKTRFQVDWIDDGQRRFKSFSVDEYGYDEALRLAVEYRKERIKELNSRGHGYSDQHGE